MNIGIRTCRLRRHIIEITRKRDSVSSLKKEMLNVENRLSQRKHEIDHNLKFIPMPFDGHLRSICTFNSAPVQKGSEAGPTEENCIKDL